MKDTIYARLRNTSSVLASIFVVVLVLTGCNLDLDYQEIQSHIPFAQQPSRLKQTDVDRAQHFSDPDGVPYLQIEGIGKQRHPAWIALYALAYAGEEVYDKRLTGIEDRRKFQACVDWLEKNLRQDSQGQWVWQYHFDSTYNDISIKAPWSSAFAQATGIQALVVAYKRTGDNRYIELARQAAQPLFTPLAAGGFLFEANGEIWFEEIPEPADNPGHILNGHMRVLLALADLYKATNDELIAEWLKRGTDTLYRWLPKFDAGYWLRYDLNPRKNDLLFRFANPYGFLHHALAIDKITLRDPVSKAEISVDVGSETDTSGKARIAGTHWGQIIQLAGRSARRLVPATLDDKPDEMRAPHTYFYLSLPDEWKDNLRNQWYELIIEYYDDAAANITVQQRSVAPGKTFRDLRDGDLHLTGAGHWRRWIVPIRPSDLGYWVGMSYAEKHYGYLDQLAQLDKRLLPWSTVAKGYLAMAEDAGHSVRQVTPDPILLPKQTPMLPIYSLDDRGVVMQHLADSSTRWNPDGTFDPSGGKGRLVYSPFIVSEQLIHGSSLSGAKYSTIDRRRIERRPALEWILGDKNHRMVSGKNIYLYDFDNAYNDIFTQSPWPSAFGQAYIVRSLIYALHNAIGPKEPILSAIRASGNGFAVRIENGGVTAVDRSDQPWYEEVPNGTHVLNAHLVSLPELSEASRLLGEAGLRRLADSGIRTLKERLHLFDTGYWLRYDQNPRKELLIQLDWIDGERSPQVDEVVLENPQTGHQVRLDIGAPGDTEGGVRLSGTDWQAGRVVNGRTTRAFANGYQIRSEAVAGGTRHNVFLVLQLPDRAFTDVFDVSPHRLVVRYKDTSKGTFAFKVQAVHEGSLLAFVPLRGGVWRLQGDQQWKEAIFTIRPQDMGWYKGPDYQQYEVEQLQRIANLTNDWFFYQYAERHRDFLALQRKGVSIINEKASSVAAPPIAMRIVESGKTHPGYGFDNSVDGDPNNDYTAGIESDASHVVVELDREASLAAIRLHWESDENRATFVRVRESLPDGSVGRTLAEDSPGPGQVVTLRLEPNQAVKRLRIDFGAFVGQPRILLRQITAVETESAGIPLSPMQQNSDPYLDGYDPNNPLSVFRTPISKSIKSLSDRLSLGANSEYDKILRFMDHIAQFRVGIEGDSSNPDTTVQYRTGACGNFAGTLLALAASQGMPGRYINMMNYPKNTGHTVAEIFHDNEWHLYDPTYNAFYIKKGKETSLPLSFQELRFLYAHSPEMVKISARTYRPGIELFTGKDIFTKANPIGQIGPERPYYFPLFIDLERNPVIEGKSIGPAYQGADYIGAAGINQNHRWVIDGLNPKMKYAFIIHPGGLGGELTTSDQSFNLNFSLENGKLLAKDSIALDFSASPSAPVEVPFEAHDKSVVLSISHPYRGPKLRYFSVLRYEIKRLNKD
ncbi:D-glucuronyl C5-epimerase family protein [Azonexus sp.]|jgi:hypothetical protein|uniref:D-glucuronyl C5-epimerase family protein n=1 Tax=Azonexus sp. TaxID=1872668 RepID=UPI0028331FAA|nr:D-glucuronyl C5-epimerase family protein [Azonexus sp.]MDR1995923.1 hypothetical protein [Azonexus sp.]